MSADSQGRELKFYSQFQTEHGDKQNPFEGNNWSSYFGRSDSFLSFSSPVESENGSYEIESDKDDDGDGGNNDYTAELSRRMAQFMLQDDDSSSTASSQSEIQNKVLNLFRRGRFQGVCEILCSPVFFILWVCSVSGI